jgi:hypothetical protein
VTVLLVGSEGNMGRRYAAVMDYLQISYTGIDKGHAISPSLSPSKVLIATPTDTHYAMITEHSRWGVPILCEKALTTIPEELKALLDMDITLAMVNQYQTLASTIVTGKSYYNNWNSGRDGIAWDCINIIGMSNTPPLLSNKSPIWQCAINGKSLHIEEMDYAYIDMIAAWNAKPYSNKEYIEKAHKRVWDGFYSA